MPFDENNVEFYFYIYIWLEKIEMFRKLGEYTPCTINTVAIVVVVGEGLLIYKHT